MRRRKYTSRCGPWQVLQAIEQCETKPVNDMDHEIWIGSWEDLYHDLELIPRITMVYIKAFDHHSIKFAIWFFECSPCFFLGNLLPHGFQNSGAFWKQNRSCLKKLSRQVGAQLPGPWSCSWSRRSSCCWSYGSRDLAWWIGSRRRQTGSVGPLNQKPKTSCKTHWNWCWKY